MMTATLMRRFGALALLLVAGSAAAEPRLSPAFGDRAVIQRDRPVTVTGTAEPGETVTVTLAGRTATARAGRDGRFAVDFPALPAGPVALSVAAPSGRTEVRDVLAGDVFLCSGQSNMEMQVERAQDSYGQIANSADPELRLLTVDKVTAPAPRPAFAKAPAWQVAGPATAGGFSAACFYMAQELRKTARVPIGAIADSWGGSAISAWMSPDALRAAGRGADAELLALYARNPAAAAQAAGRPWEAWWRAATGDRPGTEPWQPAATGSWSPVPAIDVWERWGVPRLSAYNGLVWFRREVTLTPAQAKGRATLAIGAVDDMDRTWVNGVASGAGGNPGTAREYTLPPGRLKAGRNVIVVAATDVYADGGMRGPANVMQLRLADGTALPLGKGWSYAVPAATPANPPRVPWDDVAGAGTIHNAMIAPWGRLGLKGVAWYQGESDTAIPGYAERMLALMAGWRRQFGQPDLPFAIVQLANFGTPATRPGESGWADVREAQRQAAARDNHAAVASAIDLGDPLDIHPGEKHEVGRRLARAMRALAYGDTASPSGPQAATATPTPDGGVTVSFTGVTGALATRSSPAAIGFELCGRDPGSCRYTAATAAGDRVALAGDGRPVTRVRYLWADAPVANLFDDAQLPAGPFELPVVTPR